MPAIDAIQKLPNNILSREVGTTQYKLFKPIADELDELALVFADLRTINDIQAMAAQNLDNLGQNLNELRQGRDDETYRVFLGVAIQQLASRGDINSINSIAEALGFTNINIQELYNSGLRWDGTRLLDGNTLLNGQDRSATFAFFQELNVDTAAGDFAISTSINAVRAGGVEALISFTFLMNESQGVDYTDYSSLWDGTVLLDGETALNPASRDFTPDFIAVGDGAAGEPGAGDVALQNEVLRKAAVSFTQGGEKFHQITIEQSELDGITINEFALFRGTEMMWADAFTGKLKDDETIFIFRMKETS